MTTFTFAPATREQAKARIGLQGPAGSGKTKTALRIAQGLAKGGPIGVVDTERGSAKKYATVPGRPDLGGHEFGHMPMDTHDPRNLVQAVRAAEDAQIEVLIVDSWSHFWNGRGGLLEIVEEAGSAKGSGGTFGGWRTGNPIEQQMLDALLNYRGHLIVTMRTKGDYVIEGKKVTKVGVKAVQREGAEYELDVVMDMVEGTATVTKTRYEPLTGLVVHHPGEDIGEVILEQLGQGVDPVAVFLDELRAEGLTYQGALEIHGRAERRGLLGAPAAHPVTGEAMPLGEAIKAVGIALRPSAPAASSSPTTPAHGTRKEDEAPSPARTGSDAISPQMMRKIFALLKAVGGPEDRTERLRVVGLLLGHPVGSMNELSFNDGAELIDTLAAFDGDGGRERFAATLDKLAAEFTPAA
ncbi:AAA domain-containing protein [Actinacidiphila alni]|uniref:AAA domain-containing protein n=1 Tax=Actinacidiphila alni TaxID=380248 RepID=A0A1I2G4N3_9ACTN|nr:AAA family ATPase [Actinacidiphila alni]SFF12063.1 AAA domain-containing protein [Actinacidiphila alni]